MLCGGASDNPSLHVPVALLPCLSLADQFLLNRMQLLRAIRATPITS